MTASPTFQLVGKHTILVSWEPIISEEIHSKVLQLEQYVTAFFSEEIIETVIAYHSVAIYLHEKTSAEVFLNKLEKSEWDKKQQVSNKKYIITIPVCYSEAFGTDLSEVAKLHKLTIPEVIALHIQPYYKVYFLGFLPGFPYLGGLDKQLHTPRRQTPRPYIDKGSVGVGGAQTGIYTLDSPGGWNILGRTPLHFFSAIKNPPVLVQPGDYVRFQAISRKKYDDISSQIDLGTYKLQKEVYHD
ncbi:KipI family sensor histidine kinase inhibitor [Ulvibacter sp. MAR_2010_11]|uniref:5-oxoprolinase subunit PxpB n=1 Tax=Ulvibacter sp. MAR_2010_11 TaxID=1250229 RepID=UPI000C2C17A2|nr:5-oxoprolinase subunit PxpB [Ulvibacter sp. MAR_2010_11]PKA84429.1 KipI family sensor histidine kinase inhibitor [Ulvibacter sp. MAR_2010_11]